MHFDGVEIRTHHGTLLIGSRADPDVAFWQNKLRQDRMSAMAASMFRHSHDLPVGRLRSFAAEIGLLNRLVLADDTAVVAGVLQAIETGRVSAVFLPDHHLAGSSVPDLPTSTSGKTVPPQQRAAAIDIRALSVDQRVVEMLKRAPAHTKDAAKKLLLGMLSFESLAWIAGGLVVLAVANAYLVGEALDVFIAGYVYATAGLPGLQGLYDIVMAVKDAMAARTEADLDGAAERFAEGFAKVGISLLSVIAFRASKGGAGEVPTNEPAAPEGGAPGTRYRFFKRTKQGEAAEAGTSSNPPATAPTVTKPVGEVKYGVSFFGPSNLKYYTKDGATLGTSGKSFFLMPLEDSAIVTDAPSAARYTGMSPSTLEAYKNGKDIYGLSFPTEGLEMNAPTAVDAGGYPHFLEGGRTAVKLGDGPNAGFLLNPTRELVIPGGDAVPSGSTLFQLGPDGEWITIKKF